ncbi:MAG: alpha-amylase [Anaerolineae bacterium]|nr:alpha-amylase [Anaerolineae bacterium]
MTQWPSKPVLYEINTWVWLNSLSRQYNDRITLNNVPDEVLDDLASTGLDGIWLMGVWTRSPRGAQQAKQYMHEYKPALPDITEKDIVGSPYAIYEYRADRHLGGKSGLKSIRQRLADRGLCLILDYVPNHMGIDHPWIKSHPSYLMQGTPKDLIRHPIDFFAAQDGWGRSLVMAHGRDPYFPGWSDTVQVNAFHPDFRQAALQILLDIASQCDGVRCDMAMLLVNRIFANTWQGYYIEDEIPEVEFWDEIIPQVKAAYPDFLFMAEVYWNMEYELQTMGFNYTYDKTLYDRLCNSTSRDVRVHLIADISYQRQLVRFIENHDEPRAYDRLGPQKGRPAATMIATLPGMTLLHDGQFIGRRAKLPVQIGRQPDEPVDELLCDFYERLLIETRANIYHEGTWRLFNLFPAWSDNPTYDNLVAHGWKQDHEYRLIVVNLTNVRSQALVNLSAWHDIAGVNWLLEDSLNGHSYQRSGDEMTRPGLFIDLPAYESHIFRFIPQ